MHLPERTKQIILACVVSIVVVGLGLFASTQSVTYSGTLPCADCVGIKTTLTLYANQTYQLKSLYIDKGAPFTEKGSWQEEWKNNMQVYVLKSNGMPSYYQIITSTTIKMLDGDGNQIQAPFNQILRRVD